MSRHNKLPLTKLIDERIKRGRRNITGTVVPANNEFFLQQLSLSPKTGAHTYVANIQLNGDYAQANRGGVSDTIIIKNVPIALNNREVGYAKFNRMPVNLAKSESGKLEVVGISKRSRALTTKKVTVSVVSGVVISDVEIGVIILPLPYGDFPLADGYGPTPYGVLAMYDLEGNFIELVV